MRLNISWLRPLSRGDRLIEVKIAVFEGKEIQNFDNWPLGIGWPLNTGSTVSQLSYKVEWIQVKLTAKRLSKKYAERKTGKAQYDLISI